MTPLLVLVFGFKPTVAIGTDILHGAIFKSFGAVQHRRLGHVHARMTLSDARRLGAGGSLAGVALSEWLERRYGEGFQDTAKVVLGVSLVITGAGFLLKAFLHSHADDKPFILQRKDRTAAVVIGVLGMFVVGLTSVGSGTFFGLAMLVLFPLTAVKAAAPTSSMRPCSSGLLSIGHVVGSNIDHAATGAPDRLGARRAARRQDHGAPARPGDAGRARDDALPRGHEARRLPGADVVLVVGFGAALLVGAVTESVRSGVAPVRRPTRLRPRPSPTMADRSVRAPMVGRSADPRPHPLWSAPQTRRAVIGNCRYGCR